MFNRIIDNAYKKISRLSIATLLVISGSGIAPLLFSSTAHANILGPVSGIYVSEFSSYGDNDWIELHNKLNGTVSLQGLSIRFHDPSAPQLNLDGYILGNGFIKLDVGNKLNRGGGAFSLTNGSEVHLINYGNTTNVGYKVSAAPGNGQVVARMVSYNGYTWKITSNATPGAHNNPLSPPPVIISPAPGAIQQTNVVTFSWGPVNGGGLNTLSVANDPNFLQQSKLDSKGVRYSPTSTTRTYALDEGTYYWRVGVYVDSWQWVWSDVYTLTVDKAAPTVAFTDPSPVEGSYVTDDFDVSVTAHDSSKLDSVSVNLVDDKNLETSERLKASCTYTNLDISDLTRTCRMQLPSDLPDGAYTLKIDAKDKAGINAVSQSRSIHIDRTKPIIPALITPSQDIITQGNSINHTWTESSEDTDHYVFESYEDAEATRKMSTEKVTATNLTSQDAEDLTYWWRVKAVDKAGHVSDWSELRKVTIDNTAPTVSFTLPSPADGSYVNSDIDVSLSANDNNKLDLVTISLLDNNTLNSGVIKRAECTYSDLDVANLTETCRMQLTSDLPDGTYTLQIEGRDKAGNVAITQNRSVHIDRTKPETSSLLEPSNGLVTRGNSITHTWTDSSADVDYYVLENYEDVETTRKISSEKVTTTSVTSLHQGDVTYWWRVKAVDRAGNVSDWSELRKVTLDNTAPKFSGETKYKILTGKEVTLDPKVEEENVTYKWTLGDYNNHILTNRKLNLTSSTLTISDLPKGEYSVKLVITDQVGNSTDPIEYRITVSTPSSVRPSNSR